MSHNVTELHRPRRVVLAARIAILVAIIIALRAGIETASVPIRLLCLAALGYVMVGAYVLAHELVHHRLTRWRWLDDSLGYLLLAPELVDFRDYRGGHLAHHRWVASDEDPGFVFIARERRLARAIAVIAHYSMLSYLLSHVWSVIAPPRSVSRGEAWKGVAKSIAPAMVCLPVLGAGRWLWQVALPYVAFCVFNTIKNAAEHDYLYRGADGYRDPLAVTRSLHASALTRFFWANCMYHVEHHVDPAVPFHNLPRMRETLGIEPGESYVTFARMRFRRGVEYPFFI